MRLFWPDMGVVLLAVLAMVTVKSADVKAAGSSGLSLRVRFRLYLADISR